jgi:Caspase domain
MKKMKFLFMIMSLCSLLSGQISAQTFHAVIIDGESVASNVTTELYATELRNVAQALRMTPNIKRLKAKECQVYNTLENIRCGANDVFFVGWAGHGSGAGDGFQTMATCDEEGSSRLDLSDIVDDYLVSSPARLRLVAYDCCNLGPKTRTPKFDDPTAPPTIVALYKSLFKDARGIVRLSSSSPNTASVEAKNYGGVFSNSFIESINDLSCLGANAADSWERVAQKTLTSTNEKCQKLGHRAQNPQIIYTPTDLVPRGNPVRTAPVTTVPASSTYVPKAAPTASESTITPDANIPDRKGGKKH